MSPWIRVLEAWAVAQLLRTPGFHRGVEKVARGVHRLRHGIPPDEMGGTKIDRPEGSGFLNHFTDELKAQFNRTETKETAGVNLDQRIMRGQEVDKGTTNETADAVWANMMREQQAKKSPKSKSSTVSSTVEEDADAAWENIKKNGGSQSSKQGFMGEYMSALREQMRNEKPK